MIKQTTEQRVAACLEETALLLRLFIEQTSADWKEFLQSRPIPQAPCAGWQKHWATPQLRDRCFITILPCLRSAP